MGSFGGFYKGEKKKPKKDKSGKPIIGGMTPPTFVMPELIKKKKDNF
jgi:hypothetical protein